MRISVVIPLYNKKETILRALGSVLSQTVLPEEIIVVNDGSTDGSDLLVSELNHQLIRLINQPNAGVSLARNRGIKEAKGDWLAFLDADDYWEKEFLSSIINSYNLNNRFILYGSAFQNLQNKKIKKDISDYIIGDPLTLSKLLYHKGVIFCIGSVVVMKNELTKLGGFPENIKAGEDLITWFKLSFSGSFKIFNQSLVNIDDPLPGERQIRTPFKYDPFEEHLEQFRNSIDCENDTAFRLFKALWYKIRSSTYLVNNYKYYSIIYAAKSLLCWPFNYKLYVYILLNLLPFDLGIRVFKQAIINKG